MKKYVNMEKETINIIINIVIFITSLISIIILTKIIFRTNKELDKGFKYLTMAPISVALTSLIYIDRALILTGLEYSNVLFFSSRVVAIVFFAIGVYKILKAISINNCGECIANSED